MDETPSEATTRPSLLGRLRDPADGASWQTFVGTYGPLIYGYCRLRGLQDADAADVGQEVLASVARAMRTFEYRPEQGRFRDWLGMVTRNAIRAFQRRGQDGTASTAALDEVVGPELDAEWTDEFYAQVLRVALGRVQGEFEPPTWHAFEAVWRRGQPPQEVAAQRGVSIWVVYSAKSRVLRRLREEVLMLAEDLPACMAKEQ